ncbi:hypothetical protein ABK040_014886 [Willaertia magna]
MSIKFDFQHNNTRFLYHSDGVTKFYKNNCLQWEKRWTDNWTFMVIYTSNEELHLFSYKPGSTFHGMACIDKITESGHELLQKYEFWENDWQEFKILKDFEGRKTVLEMKKTIKNETQVVLCELLSNGNCTEFRKIVTCLYNNLAY